MSLRVLGRQWASQYKNRDKRYWTGSEGHPQGQLFLPHRLPSAPIFGPTQKEAARRSTTGEKNPGAPWRTPMLQHHFLGHDPITGRPRTEPEQERLF